MNIIDELVKIRFVFEDIDYIYKHCFDDRFKHQCMNKLMRSKRYIHPYVFNSLSTFFKSEELDVVASEYSDGATYPDTYWEDRLRWT